MKLGLTGRPFSWYFKMTPNQKDVFTVVRAYILSLIDCEVVRGLGNDVPMPKNSFIAITPIESTRLSTNVNTYDLINSKSIKTSMSYLVQIDCYGPISSDWAAILCATWRDDYCVDKLAPTCAPLYADNPIQIPIIDGEANYEERWLLKAVLQYNPVVTVPQEFADEISPSKVIPVDIVAA